MVQYLTNSKFYFEIDGVTSLAVKTCSGPEIEMEVAGGDAAIGVTKDAKTQTQATIGGVKYNATVTLTYVAGNEGDQKKLSDWYNDCHPDTFSGGASKAMDSRKTGSLVIYDPNGKEAMRYNFIDLFPGTKKQISSLAVDSGGNLAEDTLELYFTQVVRAK
ncbi:phage tail protein [Leptolyngbyaceae cyanobacterium CCMR0082]|uniref:Phage tail protein n=2 Tax=Adonisia turfae TaxID=2950184 RepID=A0A6M0SFN2_9CYAN|nr:phage tail protein [Adonisia turfae]MDV3348638.1 phage tail protein [Leptothoe sp. LEGE 181152]NEZ57616.1 phage tail protein [Adonisia turfae CCMR0081]NEZ67308.1 phage tail protein [Adonisia turfae CCMR0082]